MTADKRFVGHTPGPWKKRGAWYVDGPDHLSLFEASGAACEADVALVAAAPDLLARVAELEAVLEAIRDNEDPPTEAAAFAHRTAREALRGKNSSGTGES